jgi:hypothetical protein
MPTAQFCRARLFIHQMCINAPLYAYSFPLAAAMQAFGSAPRAKNSQKRGKILAK